MKTFNKFITLLYSLIMIFIAGLLIILPFDFNRMINIDFMKYILDLTRHNFIISAIGVLLLILVFWYLSSVLKSKDNKKRGSFLAIENEHGEVKIYDETVVDLVKDVSREFEGIKNIKTSVNFGTDYIELSLTGQAESQINIPEASTNLQERTKEYVEQSTGAKVNRVNVEIVKIG